MVMYDSQHTTEDLYHFHSIAILLKTTSEDTNLFRIEMVYKIFEDYDINISRAYTYNDSETNAYEYDVQELLSKNSESSILLLQT
jgi:hypothetical protein